MNKKYLVVGLFGMMMLVMVSFVSAGDCSSFHWDLPEGYCEAGCSLAFPCLEGEVSMDIFFYLYTDNDGICNAAEACCAGDNPVVCNPGHDNPDILCCEDYCCDRNNDGIKECPPCRTNRNGPVDSCASCDDDRDGINECPSCDTKGDGVLECLQCDTDGDGKKDSCKRDIDGDGTLDTCCSKEAFSYGYASEYLECPYSASQVKDKIDIAKRDASISALIPDMLICNYPPNFMTGPYCPPAECSYSVTENYDVFIRPPGQANLQCSGSGSGNFGVYELVSGFPWYNRIGHQTSSLALAALKTKISARLAKILAEFDCDCDCGKKMNSHVINQRAFSYEDLGLTNWGASAEVGYTISCVGSTNGDITIDVEVEAKKICTEK